MNSEHSPTSTGATATRGAAEADTLTDEFTMRFSSTPRDAHLARRLVSDRLDAWGHPYMSTANETLTLLTAELAANPVRHGRVPGRDLEVRLTLDERDPLTLRTAYRVGSILKHVPPEARIATRYAYYV